MPSQVSMLMTGPSWSGCARSWDGTLFLAGIKDPHDRSNVGWSMGSRQTTHLVVRLADWGISPSFSRNCFDNTAMESTWATIKKEIRHIHGP